MNSPKNPRPGALVLLVGLLLVAFAAQSGLADTAPGKARDEVSVQALAGYLGSLRVHLERDPAFAAAYLTFWTELTQATRTSGDVEQVPDERFDDIATTSRRIARSVRERYRGGSGGYALTDVLDIAVATLAGVRGDSDGPGAAERLLVALDRVIAPRVLVDGRYEFAGDLGESADLGFGAEVWVECRQSPRCVESHDELFREAMSGVSLIAPLADRLAHDGTLRELPELERLLAHADALEQRLLAAPTAAARRDAVRVTVNDYWKSIALGLGTLELGPDPGAARADTPPTEPDLSETRTLLTLGSAGAYLVGDEALAASFAVMRSPVLELTRMLSQGTLATLAPAVAGVGLLFAGAQALSLFDSGGSRASSAIPPPALQTLVASLNDKAERRHVAAHTDTLSGTNALDARVAALGVAIDVVKDDVARLDSAQRRKVRADFLADDARRWTEFDVDNDRCFSLRGRNPSTGLLRAADFRRCEERFLQGAVRRSLYATRAIDYVLDARFIDPADVRFPFHHHYPLLVTEGGMDTKAALALANPFEWQQNAAALLRLYQEHPAADAERRTRVEVLRTLRSPGATARNALASLAVRDPAGARPTFRSDLHRTAVDEYLVALEGLTARVVALDDPEADRWGKRLTAGLEQRPPAGRKRAAIEAVLSGASSGATHVEACHDAPDDAFMAQPQSLMAESRRFFDSPVTVEELASAWNRDAVNAMELAPRDFVALVPVPFLWVSLDGLGRIDICLARFRPEVATFTREEGPNRGTLFGTTVAGAELSVRFRPSAATRRILGLASNDPPIPIAAYAAERACTFGYRNDGDGCSRAQCLGSLAPTMWNGDATASVNGGNCEGEPFPIRLGRHNLLEGAGELENVTRTLANLYWKGRAQAVARLESDVLRSSEYAAASALYMQYYALTGITLGTTGAPGALLDETGTLTPRSVLRALIDDKTIPRELSDALQSHRDALMERIALRGREMTAEGAMHRLPHLHALDDTLSRIDLALAAYATGA